MRKAVGTTTTEADYWSDAAERDRRCAHLALRPREPPELRLRVGPPLIDDARGEILRVFCEVERPPFRTVEERLSEPATIEDVLTALRELQAELQAPDHGWENDTLESYLSAMQAWLEGVAGRVGNKPSMRLIVMMLQAASVYE